MTRGHRTAHRLIWLILAPLIMASLWLAISHRPSEPVSDVVPYAIVTKEVTR